MIEAIDLFCGAGGLTRGLLDAGVQVRAGFDIDERCKYAYETNNGARFFCKSVVEVKGAELMALWSKGATRLLAGCAPCQPFSTAANAVRSDEDPRYPLLEEFTRLVQETLPELVTMENVPRVRTHKPFTGFVDELKNLGYKVWSKSVACQDYGVPQTRRRMVLMASLIGDSAPMLACVDPQRRTVAEVFAGLPSLQAGERDAEDPIHLARSLSPLNLQRIRHSKPGGTWLDWPEELRSPCHVRETGASYPTVYSRMRADAPAPTMTTQFYNFGTGRFGHPTEDRAITPREAALLQSFPKEYVFTRPGEQILMNSLGRMIGNAVPPKLGEAIGKAFAAHVRHC